MKLLLIVAVHLNFIKTAPILYAIQKGKKEGQNIQYRMVHTSQQYDDKMRGIFFQELNIPHPSINLKFDRVK
jgi:UDP-N-acetylglucosamine 2-epimerase (non-hydrolysing)